MGIFDLESGYLLGEPPTQVPSSRAERSNREMAESHRVNKKEQKPKEKKK